MEFLFDLLILDGSSVFLDFLGGESRLLDLDLDLSVTLLLIPSRDDSELVLLLSGLLDLLDLDVERERDLDDL